MEHLPEQMQKDRKALWEKYKLARNNDEEPTWFADRETGQYCFKVGDFVHKPDKVSDIVS